MLHSVLDLDLQALDIKYPGFILPEHLDCQQELSLLIKLTHPVVPIPGTCRGCGTPVCCGPAGLRPGIGTTLPL